ncbi:MAG: extracellular solute-binding protein [Spirochaetia bacterium]|nr:extracellular solute-binding protein [Spirochaetia bacterium]
MSLSQKQKTIHQLKSLISTQKETGEYLLPTENELMLKYGVGRNTLRNAVNELVLEGMLKKIQGKGTFIQDPVKNIVFLNWAETEFTDIPIMQDFITSFQKDNPAINITSESVPYTLYVKRILRHLLNNEPFDVMQITPFWLQRFKHLDALFPLTNYSKQHYIGNQYQKALELEEIDDELYAINWSLCPQVLFCNKRVMKQAGLDPDSPPETMDDFARMSRQIADASPEGTYGLCLPLDSFAYNYLQLYPFLMAFGGGFSNSINNFTVESDENVEALLWLSDLYRYSGAVNARSINAGRILFASHKVGFLIDGPYCRGHLRRLSGEGKGFDDEYMVATIPKGVDGRGESILLTHSLAISRQSKKPEEAIEWITYLCTNEASGRKYFEDFGMIPTSREVLEKPFYSNDPFASVLIRQLEQVSIGPLKHPLFIKSLPFLLQIMPSIIIDGEDPREKLRFLGEVIRIIAKDNTMIYL